MVNIKADECLQCELVCSVNMLIYMLFSGTNLLLRVLGPSWGGSLWCRHLSAQSTRSLPSDRTGAEQQQCRKELSVLQNDLAQQCELQYSRVSTYTCPILLWQSVLEDTCFTLLLFLKLYRNTKQTSSCCKPEMEPQLCFCGFMASLSQPTLLSFNSYFLCFNFVSI